MSADSDMSIRGNTLPAITPWALLALWTLTVTLPFFQLITSNPTYLTAHQLAGGGLLLFVVALAFVVPLLLHVIARPFPRLLRNFYYWLLVAALCFAFASQLLRGWLAEVHIGVELAGVTALSIVLLVFIYRSVTLREWLGWASVLALVLVAGFWWMLPDAYLAKEAELPESPYQLSAGEPQANLVFVVFDELSLPALLDQNAELRADTFPSFAQLAATADWFKQASTVAAGTRLAVPALLTGKRPVAAAEPDTASYPVNLFTILAPDFSFNVQEPVTRLCAQPKCDGRIKWQQTAIDSLIVVGHLTSPRVINRYLPPVGQQWSGFGNITGGAVPEDERVQGIRVFTERLTETPTPGLHFLHTVLPHIPYTVLPNGRRLLRHDATSGHLLADGKDMFIDQPWATAEARALYLWQLQYVDAVLGKVMAELKSADQWDNTLLVVTADHGVQMSPGESRREPSAEHFIDIASVPLFIKWPMQQAGVVHEQAFESVEILDRVLGRLGYESIEKTERGASTTNARSILATAAEVALPARFDFSTSRLPLSPAQSQSAAALPRQLVACSKQVEPENAVLYAKTHPEHFLAAHVLIKGADWLAETGYVEFGGELSKLVVSGESRLSAFVDPNAFRRGHNRLRVVQRRNDAWCSAYDNGSS